MTSSRSEASLAIRAGKVTVSGRPAAKASMLVAPGEPVVMAAPGRRFVSRGGEKLDAAFDRFDVVPAPNGRLALDAGASTGGFTDVLLRRGASQVVALDVGYGQLDWRLREDPRVITIERTNVRDLDPSLLPYAPDLVTADLSFISLRLALPSLSGAAAPAADFVLLVKPQFEAGRVDVGQGGVVSDPAIWQAVLQDVCAACEDLGLQIRGLMASPLLGPAGNVEFLLHAGRPARAGTGAVTDMIERAVNEGLELRGSDGRAGGGGGSR
jgi:23S rRNA (cytidine1920-2'-O)/16S rRNA (cytidine1409-2'-O)-methyltransferase